MPDFPKHPECGIKMYGSVVVGSKGQIVIPKDVREILGIRPGDSLVVVTKHQKAIGIIKSDDLEAFMDYMKRELETTKRMAHENTETL